MNIFNLFKKSSKKDNFRSDAITALKPARKKEKENTFIGDFDALKKRVSLKENNSSLILGYLLIDSPVFRPDLEFIGNSRIAGKPIYKYIGKDFSKFNLPYEEVFSAR